MTWRLLFLDRSQRRGKKWVAVFEDVSTGRTKTTHFGQAGASDYTMHKDPERRRRYIERHGTAVGRGREDWYDPTSAGALSRWILWNKPTLKASVADFVRRFGLAGEPPRASNPNPALDRAMRAEALRRWKALRTWLSNTTRAEMKDTAVTVGGKKGSSDWHGVYWWWWSTIDPTATGPDRALIFGLGPHQQGEHGAVPGSFASVPSPVPEARAAGGYLNFLRLSGVLKKPFDLSQVETRVVGFREVFLHETIHLLDRLRWTPADWPRAMEGYRQSYGKIDTYYRHPLEWNAYFQAGWQLVEDAMAAKAKIDVIREGSSNGLEATLAQGWDAIRLNLSGYWEKPWLDALRKEPEMWKRFLSRARQAYEESRPMWRAMLRNAKKQRRDRIVAAKAVQRTIARGKRPTKAMMAAAGLDEPAPKKRAPRLRRPTPAEVSAWRQEPNEAALAHWMWSTSDGPGLDTPEGEARFTAIKLLVKAWVQRGWLPGATESRIPLR